MILFDRLLSVLARWPVWLRRAVGGGVTLLGAAGVLALLVRDTFELCLGKSNCRQTPFGDEPWLWPVYALGAALTLGPVSLWVWRR